MFRVVAVGGRRSDDVRLVGLGWMLGGARWCSWGVVVGLGLPWLAVRLVGVEVGVAGRWLCCLLAAYLMLVTIWC